jgi:Xaa-Pro aminopeptidase
MPFLDRRRARTLMQEAGIDALVLFQPENFSYATGGAGGVAAMWRRGGASIAVVPSDPQSALPVVVGDLDAAYLRAAASELDIRAHPIWIDTVDLTDIPRDGRPTVDIVQDGYRRASGANHVRPRPTTFDLAAALGLLRDVLGEYGLDGARLGIDLEFLPAADYFAVAEALPEASLVDGSALVRRLRSIKTPAEIERLRRGCALAEAGLARLTAGVATGQSRREVSALWRAGVAEAVAAGGVTDLTGQWDYVSVGPDPWGSGGTVVPGAVIKADVGCIIGGYSSDGARSYSFGPADPVARDVYAALRDAFETGIAAIRPGVALSEVYERTAAVMHRAGYEGYRRGHFGHGLGASVGMEEWPFIAADSDVVAEPGMVLAFETPFYATGIGSLTIEDQLLVTESGIEVMSTVPREFLELG